MSPDYTAKPFTPDHAARIAERAYHLWESEGRPHGKAVEHWLQAEIELAAHSVPHAAAADPKPSTLKRVHSKGPRH